MPEENPFQNKGTSYSKVLDINANSFPYTKVRFPDETNRSRFLWALTLDSF